MKCCRCLIPISTSLLLLACNLSGTLAAAPAEAGAEGLLPHETTTAAQTMEDTAAGTPDPDPTQSEENAAAAGSSPAVNPALPAPTAANPASNPGGSNPSGTSSSGSPLSITGVSAYPNSTVFYGHCEPADPTVLHVEALLDPLDQVHEVYLWYDVFDPGGAASSGSSSMWQLGIGDYAADLDIGQIGAVSMGTSDGSVSFWIEAVDRNGSSYYSSTYSVTIQYCTGGILGDPPPAPPVILSFSGNSPVQVGEWVSLAWETSDAACGVTLDGGSVDATGQFNYVPIPDDAGKTYTHTLVAFGEPCSNPSQVSKTVSITVTSAVNTAKGSGTLFAENSLDLGDGGGDDVLFDADSSETILLALWGTELALAWQADVAACEAQLSGGGSLLLNITANDIVCYRTSSGNYGYLTITGLYLDLYNPYNSSVDLSYTTEIQP